MRHPFQPGAATETIAATTTSASVTRDAWSQYRALQIANAGPDVVHVAWGKSQRQPGGALTATTADYPVLAGATVVVVKGDADHVAVRAASSSATVYLTPGEAR